MSLAALPLLCGLLGPAEPGETFTFSRERHVEVDGKVAEAVLGRFQKDKEQFMAVLEGKRAIDMVRSLLCQKWRRLL